MCCCGEVPFCELKARRILAMEEEEEEESGASVVDVFELALGRDVVMLCSESAESRLGAGAGVGVLFSG